MRNRNILDNNDPIEIGQQKNKYKGKSKSKINKSFINYLIDLGLIITFSTTFITGVLKFPGLLSFFTVNPRSLPMYELTILHDYGAILMGFLILSHLLLHGVWIKKMTIKHLKLIKKKNFRKRLVAVFIIILILLVVFQIPAIRQLLFGQTNIIKIEGVGDFQYEPDKIDTIRPDIFRPGHFSIFDILVYLNNRSKIKMDYHFDETMNTYVIDKINGKGNWWYVAYYDGGWEENNVFRMDHFPYKEKMTIRIFREKSSVIERIHEVYRAEVQRKTLNGGSVIIPKVIITGENSEHLYQNVEVTHHNKRNDILQDDVITALDVIMSLGDSGLIEYKLNWYSEIGYAEVKNYFVDKINNDKSEGRCGFVYEEGSSPFSGFSGNHIHIPSDIRVLNSPEYVEWFWICV